MDGAPGRSALLAEGPGSLIALRQGKAGRGRDLASQRGSSRASAETELSADEAVAPSIQFQPQLGPGDPYPQPPGREARYSLNSGPHQDLLKLGLKNVLQMIFPIFSDFKGSLQCGCLINGEIQLNLIMQ